MAHADIIWSTFTGLLIWEESKREINPKKDFLKSTLGRACDIFCHRIIRDRKSNDNEIFGHEKRHDEVERE
jgi:hypothetical protein